MDLTDVKQHVIAMEQADLIAVDTETTGIDGIKTGRDYAIGVSVAYRLGPLGVFSAYFPLRHDVESLPLSPTVDLLAPVLRDKPLVFHNRKFDLFSLKTLGITDFRKIHYDTAIEMGIVNEEWPTRKLDFLGKMVLNRGKDSEKIDAWTKMYGWGTHVPPHVMSDYAKVDAEVTLESHEVLWKRMIKEDTAQLWPSEYEFNNLLYEMESRGVGINKRFCEEKLETGLKRMAELESVLSFSPSKSGELSDFFFNELKMPVLKETPAGKPSLDKHVMEEYDELLAASDNPVAKLVLEYRGWQKATSSLYKPMLELEVDGLVHCNFNQGKTKTGRLSCDSPNLQQIPRKSEKEWNGDARKAFDANDPDYDLIGYDYSQLELRLATAYGQEQRLIEEFLKDDADPFTAYMDVIGCTRQETKTFFYSNIYGAGTAKIAYTLGRDLDDVRPLHTKFLNSIPGITFASKRAGQLAADRKYVRYWTGRRRHFPYGEGSYRAFNSILQGGAAELVKHAMLRMREIENDDIQMVLQVHDEIVFRVRRGTLDKYDARIREIMTDFPQFGVRFAVESKVWNA
jgi:DNA polymerase-1